MRLRTVLLFPLLASAGCATTSPAIPPAAQAAPASEDARLDALLAEDWEQGLRDNPTFATYIGDPRYNDRLPDLSPEAIAKREAYDVEVLKRLKALERSRLSEARRIDYDLFLDQTQLSVAGQRFPGEYLQLSRLGGVHTELAELARAIPKRSAKDYEDFVKRLRAVPTRVEQALALMREGTRTGVTPPRVTLQGVAENLRGQAVDDAKASPIYKNAFEGFPPSLKADEARLRGEVERALSEAVLPAYRELLAFYEAEYLPRTRESIAATALPDGKAWYEYLVRRFTTVEGLTAESIHETGLAEVKRIRGRMEEVKAQAGFQGTLADFFTHLRTDARFFFKDADSLVVAYRDITKRADPELPRLFGQLPRLPYGVRPVPEYAQRTSPAAYYSSGSQEAGRGGYFYANTYDLASRPKWEMESIALHEAVPGHHLQLALQAELGELPMFRRFGGYGAYTEGWGLYSEGLGEELGLYQDPYSRFGRLNSEMWRAVRLVVDTGMHAKGWTREQAIQFFLENVAKTRHEAAVEVDRYITMPGQALSYKMGELKLQELRALAMRELGARFDVRAFHDFVLGSGSLPLSVLESRTKAWVAEQKARPASP
jgi:uncharacterized protein (DUF885 family)